MRSVAVQPAALAQPRTVSILGSTGSIGRSTVDLLLSQKNRFHVRALTACRNVDLLAEQARALNAEVAVIADASLYENLKMALSGTDIKAMAGDNAVIEAAGIPVEWTMAAIVGAAGVRATLKAISLGKTVALANKESLVCAGLFMMEAVRCSGATLLPVDSEHNAIFQVFNPGQKNRIERIILTASGGPFLHLARDQLCSITPEQAMRHPVWKMGGKISVDSATMMNKSLEIIEAHYLFNLSGEKIDVLIHPQSIVHSMVEYCDGSVLAQMGAPDMHTPIAHTLAWPDRMDTTGHKIDFSKKINFSFERVDLKRFPSIKTAKACLSYKNGACVVFNAANEIAVNDFMSKKLKFSAIESVVDKTLQAVNIGTISNIDDVFALDTEARRVAENITRGENGLSS